MGKRISSWNMKEAMKSKIWFLHIRADFVHLVVKAVENLEVNPMKEICKEYENKGITLDNICTGCGYRNHYSQNIEIPKFMDAYNENFLAVQF